MNHAAVYSLMIAVIWGATGSLLAATIEVATIPLITITSAFGGAALYFTIYFAIKTAQDE